MTWEYETVAPDDQCKLFGVNIFDYDWQTTRKRVKAQDPCLAAGEFSNCVWGFYLEKNG